METTSDFEVLQGEIAAVADSLARYSQAVGRATGAHDLAIRKVWADIAELRDELHALANRVETLTRARLTEPAETAGRMVAQGPFPKDERLRVARADYDPETGETTFREPESA